MNTRAYRDSLRNFPEVTFYYPQNEKDNLFECLNLQIPPANRHHSDDLFLTDVMTQNIFLLS
jgi:hypothetical protein